MAGGEPDGPGLRGSGRHDQALRILGDQRAHELAALFAPGTTLEAPLPDTLPASERRVDWLWRGRFAGTPCALHVEFQLRGQEDMAHRMFAYGSRIATQHKLVPQGVLVYLVPTQPMATSPFLMALPGKQVFRYDFEVIHLWEVDPAPILAGDLGGLLPLVPLMQGATPEQLPALAEQVLKMPGLEMHQRGDMLGLLSGFSTLRFPKVDVWAYFRRSIMWSEVMDELVQQSPYLRQIHEEGREEGRLLEARALVREMAQERFPDLSAADLAAIDQVTSLDRLHAIRRALAGMADVQMLRELLGQTQTEE